MSYRPGAGRNAGPRLEPFEKSFHRRGLEVWDRRWHELSIEARRVYLNEFKPAATRGRFRPRPVPIDRIPGEVRGDLIAAKLVEAAVADKGPALVVSEASLDFAIRIHALREFHPLDATDPEKFLLHIVFVFQPYGIAPLLTPVLSQAGVTTRIDLVEVLGRFVARRRWPVWVAEFLKNPLADRVANVLLESEGPLPLVDLHTFVEGARPEPVREVVDAMINRLALDEDLDPETLDLVVGVPPAVKADHLRASKPRERPPLVVCEAPDLVGPTESVLLDDLLAVMLEIASQPCRLRQDGSLYQKEEDRFLAALPPLPEWLVDVLEMDEANRLNPVLTCADTMELFTSRVEGNKTLLVVNDEGERWLASGRDAQYDSLFKTMAEPQPKGRSGAEFMLTDPEGYVPYGLDWDDARFLGVPLTVARLAKGKPPLPYWHLKSTENLLLRAQLDRVFSSLTPGVFYSLRSVLGHFAYGPHNPLNLGLNPDEVAVYFATRLVSSLEEDREEMAGVLLDRFARDRLIRLGCVQAAVSPDGDTCIARLPRLDAYFGRKVAASDMAPASESTARVVVQPDFSVVVIGMNTGPVADLSPFCERTSTSARQGATIFKITRDSIVKAVSNGLAPREILDRLNRHASLGVPDNVLKEVQAWATWVRRVEIDTRTLIRCPDRETADRVMTALRRNAERLNDTIVAIDHIKISAADRARLKTQGILISRGP